MAAHSNKSTPSGLPDHGRRLAYRLREIEAMTGIPVSTLRRMIRSGDLNPIVGFRTWLIAADDLDAILNKRLRNRPTATSGTTNP